MTSSTALGTPRLAAGRAALGFIRIAPISMISLIISAEGEWLAALYTG